MAISAREEDIVKMRQKSGASFALLADPTLEVIESWGVADAENQIAYPATFVVDTEGKIRYVHIGEDKKDRPVLEDVLTVVRYLSES